MASKLAQLLHREGVYYGDPFLVVYTRTENGHQQGDFLGHEYIRVSEDHPRIIYDFFVFYKNSNIDALPQFNDTLQLYDINKTNIMNMTEITRTPFWAPNPVDEDKVQRYLNYVEEGIVNGDMYVEPLATARYRGIIPSLIRGIASLVGGNKNRNGYPIDV